MRTELTPLRIALLVLYATTRTTRGNRIVGGASAYAVERLIRSRLGGAGGYRKTACYENSKRLVELGYLEAVLVEEGPRPTTIYQATEKGIDAVRAWTETPTAAPRIDSDLVLRIRALPYTPPEVALGSLRALRPHLTGLLAVFDAEAIDPDLSGPEAELEREYFQLVLGAHLRWLARAEKHLARSASASRRRTRGRGVVGLPGDGVVNGRGARPGA
jgi:DNA-binding PadR family transcriptional regulator